MTATAFAKKFNINFSLKRLERPTILAGISYIVLCFMILLPVNIGSLDPRDKPQQPEEKPSPYDFKYRLLLLVVLLIPILVSLYSIQCMIGGKCYVWSYVNAIFICIWVTVFVTSVLLYEKMK